MIEIVQSYENSKIVDLTFRWQGMTISLVGMLPPDGARCLSVLVAGAQIVEPVVDGSLARWIISKEDLERNAALASTISNGSAENVIGKSMEG